MVDTCNLYDLFGHSPKLYEILDPNQTKELAEQQQKVHDVY